MAILNLLQSKFTGRLGDVSGSTWKGKATVRASVFSKAPPNAVQTASVRSFEKLNRIAGAIARIGFANTGLSAKGLHNHNAVARWLKPAIRDHVFNPANIAEVIPPANDILLTAFTFNYSTREMLIKFSLSDTFVPIDGSNIFVIVFDENAKVIFSICTDQLEFSTRLVLEGFNFPVYSLIAFYSEPTAKGFVCKNFIYKARQGMNYSLSEQLTGDLWIDGRPIYQKTLYRAPGTINPATSNRIDFPLPNVMKVIDYKLTADWNNPNKQSSAGEVSYWSSASLPNSLVIVNICVDQVTQNIYFYVSTADNSMAQTSAAHAFHATVFYTKTSDTPAVGG